MRHRVEMERVKIRRVRALNHLLNILSVFFFSFYLSGALVKTEREVLIKLTNLTCISR